MEKSLPVITLGTVSVLWSEPTLLSLLSPKEDEDKALKDGFLEGEEVETAPCNSMSLRPFSEMNLFMNPRTGPREKV